MIGVDLREATLERANLNRANLTRATLRRASLKYASLQETILLEADLSDTIMCQSNLSKARLRKANLINADLSKATLNETNLTYIKYDNNTIFPEGFRVEDAAKIWLDWHPIPLDPFDKYGWDNFWKVKISQGASDDYFYENFERLPYLASILKERGFSTILFAGNGISLEPFLFADLGFAVTVLDLSAEANRFLGNLSRYIESNYATFKTCLQEMKLSQQSIQRLSSSIQLVTGDIYQSDCCSGPFDVIISRRSLQCYWDRDFDNGNKVLEGIQALLERLSPNGLLYFHSHNFSFFSEEVALKNYLIPLGVSLVDEIEAIKMYTNQKIFYLKETSG